MADLKRLNSAIEQLEAQAKSLEPATRIQQQLEGFRVELDKLRQSLAGDHARLQKIANEAEVALSQLNASVEKLNQEQKEFRKVLRTDFGTLSQNVGAAAATHEEKVATLLRDHYRDTQSLFEKHKSDIQVEIRNEGAQIQRGLENTITEKDLALHTFIRQNLTLLFAEMNNSRRYMITMLVLSILSLFAVGGLYLWGR